MFLVNIGRAAADASLGAQSWITELLGKIINDKKKYIRVISISSENYQLRFKWIVVKKKMI